MSDEHHIGPLTIEPAHERPTGATTFESEAERRHAWRAVMLLGLVQLMVVLDASITNVALPSINADLGISEADSSWIVNAYVLVFGGFLLLGGRLGDLFGRRLLFMVGLVVFAVGSLLGGLSEAPWQIIAARAFQGFGGALLAPAVLAITASLFPEGSERNKAFGVLGGIAGSGGAIGVLLGGVLTEKLSWEWVFYVNVPIALVAVVAAPLLLAESREEGEERSSDVWGALTVTGGIAMLVYAMVDANDAGWSSSQTILLLAGAVALLAAFWWTESHVSKPLVRLGIFRNRSVTGANIVAVVIGAALFSMFFFITFYMQQVLGLSPLESGLRYLPLALSIIVSAGMASALATRFGFRNVLLFGLTLTAIGLAWFTQISVDGSFLEDVLGPSMIAGAGLGFIFVPLTLAAVSGVRNEETGLASGLINTTQNVGGALGLAVLLTQFTSRSEQVVKERVAELTREAGAASGAAGSPAAAPEAMERVQQLAAREGLTEGIQAAFAGGVVFAVIGLVLAAVLVRAGDEDRAAPPVHMG